VIILNADDYGLSEGINAGIEELAYARRISATSALVTGANWPQCAARLTCLRNDIAVGLHVNLTLASPLGAMPGLAASGTLPRITNLLSKSLSKRINAQEVAAEVSRQIDRFREYTGHAPDIVDGHEHVHVVSGIRAGFLQAVAEKLPGVLVRDPSDKIFSIFVRRTSAGKALILKTLAFGFGAAVRRTGLITNHGFAGFSAFDRRRPFEREFTRFLRRPGLRHIIMCHPGRADYVSCSLDPIFERRGDELAYLLTAPRLPELIWHLNGRDKFGRPVWA
jgi:predicted glycoside hydrolase/deacetylase ChbG (UPF0249 family)